MQFIYCRQPLRMLFGKGVFGFHIWGKKCYGVWLNNKMLRSAFLAGKLQCCRLPNLSIYISEYCWLFNCIW